MFLDFVFREANATGIRFSGTVIGTIRGN